MCRYGFSRYREQYACLSCRRCFKLDRDRATGLCPACGAQMVRMGREFKVPKRGATSQWRKVKLLVQVGITFGVGHCGCGGVGYRPQTLAEAKPFVAEVRASVEHIPRKAR